MPPPTNAELNAKREDSCIAVTHERKYYKVGRTWIKRSLRPTEWQKQNGYMHVPLFNPERVLNEGACLLFLTENTDIPLPKLYACFEDDGAAYIVTEYVEGVGMNELDAKKKDVVVKELNIHMETLKRLKSNKWGGPSGLVLPPWRVMKSSGGKPWKMKPRDTQDLVFCHNDLSANNVIVDPKTLKITAIVDWEYAGFYTPDFEYPFFNNQGSFLELSREANNTALLIDILANERM